MGLEEAVCAFKVYQEMSNHAPTFEQSWDQLETAHAAFASVEKMGTGIADQFQGVHEMHVWIECSLRFLNMKYRPIEERLSRIVALRNILKQLESRWVDSPDLAYALFLLELFGIHQLVKFQFMSHADGVCYLDNKREAIPDEFLERCPETYGEEFFYEFVLGF